MAEAWAEIGRGLAWDEPFDTVFDGATRHGRWFVGGRLNVAANCLDRHLADRGEQVAIHWEGEPGERRSLTYAELHAEVVALAEGLRGLEVGPGDRVAVHLGWIPEAVVVLLACARVGAVQTVLPVPLPPEALADRLADVTPRVLVTQDAAWRHGVMLPLKARADEALAAAGVEHTVVVRRTGVDVAWYEGDRWYHELLAGPRSPASPVTVDADHPLLITHLANRRGRPAGIVHRSAGLLAYAVAMHERGLVAQPDDVLWCAVDLGWMAGQTHGVYGPLAAGATSLLFEGTLDVPTHDRAWQLIERYGVQALVTTPSVVRNLREWVDSPPRDRMALLRRIVTAGEAIDPALQAWLANEVGRGRAAVADGWGQTELGGIVTVSGQAPGTAPLPDPRLDIAAAPHSPGEVVVHAPWPGMFLGVHGDSAALDRYWHRPGVYSTGDAARQRTDGTIEFLGRIDPVLSVSGQLVSATEIRDVLAEHPFVIAAEVVGRTEPHGGQSVVACIVLDPAIQPGEKIAADVRAHIHDTLGGLARPRVVAFCDALPGDRPRTELRRALWTLCAATTGALVHLSTAQLEAAFAASAAGEMR